MDTTDSFTVNPGWAVLLADLGVSTVNVLRRADLPGDCSAVLYR